MFNSRRLSAWPKLLLLLLIMSTSGLAQGQKPTTSPTPTPTPRHPLPKPSSGSRGFEQYSQASSRAIAVGATRGIGDALEPNAPMEGLAYGAQPFFLWGFDGDAKAYHFVLYEGDVYSNPSAPIVFEKDTTENQLIYPKDAPSLKPGELYSWRAIRIPASGAQPRQGRTPTTFFILAGKDADEITDALAKANLKAPQTVADKLRQARLFEEYGIWYDALRLANEMTNASPGDTKAEEYYDSLLSKLEKKSGSKVQPKY